MSESTKPASRREGRAVTRADSPEVAAALLEVEAARADASAALDGITDATKRALDLPAKVRRNPVKSAALLGGTGFLLAGGPQRLLRFALGSVRPIRADRYEGLLPDEVEKVLRDSGLAKDPAIRRALDEDFADYLRKKGRYAPDATPATVLWRTFDRLAGPLGTAGARILVGRLMSAEKDREAVRADLRAASRARARKGGGGTTA